MQVVVLLNQLLQLRLHIGQLASWKLILIEGNLGCLQSGKHIIVTTWQIARAMRQSSDTPCYIATVSAYHYAQQLIRPMMPMHRLFADRCTVCMLVNDTAQMKATIKPELPACLEI